MRPETDRGRATDHSRNHACGAADRAGDLDRLVFTDSHPTPAPGPGQVLIRVAACGLNNTGFNTRTGWYSKGVSDATTGKAFDTADDEDASWGGAVFTFPRIQGADICGRDSSMCSRARAATPAPSPSRAPS